MKIDVSLNKLDHFRWLLHPPRLPRHRGWHQHHQVRTRVRDGHPTRAGRGLRWHRKSGRSTRLCSQVWHSFAMNTVWPDWHSFAMNTVWPDWAIFERSWQLVFLKKMGQSRPLFCLFLFFSRYNFNTNWKKRRWCAWDLNLGPQDGRHRQNHGAMAATQLGQGVSILLAH